MTRDHDDIDVGAGDMSREEAVTLAEISEESPERLLLRVEDIRDELARTDSKRVEKSLLITLLNVARRAPEECLPVVGTVARYIDSEEQLLQEYAVNLIAEVSRQHPGEVSDYVPAMVAAGDSDDDVAFFATAYLANVAEHEWEKIHDVRHILEGRIESSDVDTGNFVLAALKPVVERRPDAAVEMRATLNDGIHHEDESRRLMAASVIRKAVGTNPQYLREFESELRSILSDESADVRELGIAAFVDLREEGALEELEADGLKDHVAGACETTGIDPENRARLLEAIER